MSYEGGRTPPQTLGSLEAPWSPRGNPANESARRREYPDVYGGGAGSGGGAALAGGGAAALSAPPALPAPPADVAAVLAAVLATNGYERESNPLAYQEAHQIATNFNDLDVFKDIFLANNVLEVPLEDESDDEDESDAFVDLESYQIRKAENEFGQISEYLIDMLEKPFRLPAIKSENVGAGAGAGAGLEISAQDEALINNLVSLANDYDSDLAYLSSFFADIKEKESDGTSNARSDNESHARSTADSAISASSLASQQMVGEITAKTDMMITLTQKLLDKKQPEEKIQITQKLTGRRQKALNNLILEAQKFQVAPTSSAKDVADKSREAELAAFDRHQKALQRRRATLQAKTEAEAAAAKQAAAKEAAAAAKKAAAGGASVGGLSAAGTDLSLGQAIQGPLVGQRIEGPSPDDQARFAHGQQILDQRDIPCDICDRRIIRKKFQFDHSLPVNYEAFTCRIFLGYTYNNRESMIKYWKGELIYLIQFLGGPAHQSCNGSKGKKKGLTCPEFNDKVGFSKLNYNIDSLIDITYTKLVNDAVLVKDVLEADMPADMPAAITACLKAPANTPEILQIIYYILQRLSFSVAKLRPVKHFMQTYLDFNLVNDRLKYVRGKQAEAAAKVRVGIAATDAAAESAGVKTADIKTVPNEHVERLASARAAIEALRETIILPYNKEFDELKGEPINFYAPADREMKFPQLPFFRPTSIDDGVLPPMIWKETESPVKQENIENIKSIQRLLSSNSGSILKCIKDAFDLLRQPDGVGPAALKAIQDAQQGIKNLQPVFQGKEKKPRIDQVEAEGPRGAGGGKQRKTRFRKRQTQKRKTRKNRKQRK